MYEVLIDKPRYKNNLKALEFLGQFGKHDLYFFCDSIGPAVLYRYGDNIDREFNLRDIDHAPSGDAIFREALRRVKLKGLICTKS